MKKSMNFIKTRKICVIVSLCIFAVGVLCNLIWGTKMSIEFRGGTRIRYSYAGDADVNAIEAAAKGVLGSGATAVKENVNDNDVITVSLASEISLDAQQQLTEKLQADFADNNLVEIASNSLAAPMGRQFFIKCLVAILLAAVFLLIYVGFRFRRIGGVSAGAFALLALAHDLLICYFVFVIFRIELDGNFVAVMLTILGYSLNDTIVIFDRIRENRRLHKNMAVSDVVNLSINQSFYRTLITSITTIVALATIVIVGLVMHIDSILSFALPMLFGVISGFYSSVFLSTPLWALWREHKEAKLKAQKIK